MLEHDRLNAIIRELEEAAPEEQAKAVLDEGDDVVELARLIGNRSALYRIAASILRATLQPGVPTSAEQVFSKNTGFYLSGIVERDDPEAEIIHDQQQTSALGNWLLGLGCVAIIVLAILGLASVVGWLL